jgi:integrase
MAIRRKKKRDDQERSACSDKDIADLKAAVLELGVEYPHRKWVPLIGMYSGMRIGEICQLEVADIIEVGGTPAFDINEAGDKRLKTPQSERIIPIHPELIRLGLLEYVNDLRKKGVTRLFPELRKGRDGYSQSVSRWFGRFKKTFGFEPQFHSLRHTVATKLREAGVPMDLISDILGHSRSGSETGRYAKEASVPRKLDALAKLVD